MPLRAPRAHFRTFWTNSKKSKFWPPLGPPRRVPMGAILLHKIAPQGHFGAGLAWQQPPPGSQRPWDWYGSIGIGHRALGPMDQGLGPRDQGPRDPGPGTRALGQGAGPRPLQRSCTTRKDSPLWSGHKDFSRFFHKTSGRLRRLECIPGSGGELCLHPDEV